MQRCNTPSYHHHKRHFCISIHVNFIHTLLTTCIHQTRILSQHNTSTTAACTRWQHRSSHHSIIYIIQHHYGNIYVIKHHYDIIYVIKHHYNIIYIIITFITSSYTSLQYYTIHHKYLLKPAAITIHSYNTHSYNRTQHFIVQHITTYTETHMTRLIIGILVLKIILTESTRNQLSNDLNDDPNGHPSQKL